MISNQILQNTIEGIKTISRMELCIVDIDGKVIASSCEEMDSYAAAAMEFAQSPADSQEEVNRLIKALKIVVAQLKH